LAVVLVGNCPVGNCLVNNCTVGQCHISYEALEAQASWPLQSRGPQHEIYHSIQL